MSGAFSFSFFSRSHHTVACPLQGLTHSGASFVCCVHHCTVSGVLWGRTDRFLNEQYPQLPVVWQGFYGRIFGQAPTAVGAPSTQFCRVVVRPCSAVNINLRNCCFLRNQNHPAWDRLCFLLPPPPELPGCNVAVPAREVNQTWCSFEAICRMHADDDMREWNGGGEKFPGSPTLLETSYGISSNNSFKSESTQLCLLNRFLVETAYLRFPTSALRVSPKRSISRKRFITLVFFFRFLYQILVLAAFAKRFLRPVQFRQYCWLSRYLTTAMAVCILLCVCVFSQQIAYCYCFRKRQTAAKDRLHVWLCLVMTTSPTFVIVSSVLEAEPRWFVFL